MPAADSPAAPVHITRREWWRVGSYAVVLILLTLAPYWLGWATAGDERVFSGFLFGVDDGHSYIGKMRLGAQGQWDFRLFYTAEDHDSAGLIFLPYILPGQVVGRFIPETDPTLTPTLIGTYHLMRVVFNALLIAVLYRFIAVFLRATWARFFALIVATLGGGFGWLLLLAGGLPPEWYIPEGFTLQILLGLPHLALARALLLLGFLALFASLNRTNWPAWALLAGACWLIVGLAVPFYLAILYCILGVWGLALWLRNRVFPLGLFWRCLLAGLVTLPYFAYNAYIFSTNPAFAQWSAQNLLASPSPLDYLLAYLPLAALAVIGGRWAWHKARTDSRYALLIGWPVIVPVLVYLPINVQRRMAEAVIVPLAILAAAGVLMLARRAQSYRRGRQRVGLVALLALLPASLFLLVGAYFTAMSSSPPTKFPAAQITALDWLNQNAQPGEVVLSTFATGNLVPAYTHLYSYVGHGPETLNAVAKTAVAERFFAADPLTMSADERADLLREQGIDYVFYGPAERQFNPQPEVTPTWAQGLDLIYTEGEYAIYAVQP